MLSITDELDFKVEHGLYAVKFWATWCGPCKAYAPTVEKLDQEFDNVTFLSIDVDQVPALAQKYKIKSLPSLIFIKDGQEVERVLGMAKITPLRSKLKQLGGKDSSEKEEKEASLKAVQNS